MGFATNTMRYVLPALIPSWRFFKSVGPSPRIEYRLLGEMSDTWQDAMPRPANVRVSQMLGRFFWNAHWNEYLFLVSCAERVVGEGSLLAEREILTRIARILNLPTESVLHMRLVFVTREGMALRKTVAHESEPMLVSDLT